MNARKAAGIAAALAVASAAGTALACGGDPMAENLVAKPAVKSALVTAYVAAHPGRKGAGLERGRTYYGMVGGDWYAVASFHLSRGTTKPVILVRHGNRPDRWHVVRETRGGICGRFVPVSMIGVWHLHHVGSTDCFVEPAVAA